MTEKPDSQQFVRATMRHFAELRASGPANPGHGTAFPEDWFDLPADFLSDFGSLFYLASLTRYHRPRPLQDLFACFEPPLRLGQYKLFRSGGHPRAAITWAGLSPQAEYALAIDHRALHPEEWNSGPSLWLVDFIAPFGHIDQIVPLLTHNPEVLRIRTLWHNKPGTRYRIVECSRSAPDAPISIKSYGIGQFKRLLKESGHGRT
ncbi:hemolysin-activating ACP:hemolysin acyltransferase [Roseovarius halotolerans]|uniref:RTX toxin-activating lysine-acyltransferase n=1 Tax=Roseovarius halotolerans TaxID=505353 RepID=A0A1X6Z3G0_9RHOB|nr:toxin-activating lysine-acyltransferase [Roseovarius halotolerans]RKT32426.1 hemolysin-activating ACP:hemolysin acyltransferase [Roseovarius halotolerans]SLN37506.1 Cyclolysin-activating lysine-acyltransferase CyaC [Roseovarius halotolerans]